MAAHATKRISSGIPNGSFNSKVRHEAVGRKPGMRNTGPNILREDQSDIESTVFVKLIGCFIDTAMESNR